MPLKRLAVVLIALFVPAVASAGSTVWYTNRSDRPLHIYFAVAAHGAGITCESFSEGGVLWPGETWGHYVPDVHWTWVRFVENPIDGACDPERYGTMYSGSGYVPQAVNVW
jgi:hypothetical protein